MAQYDQIALEYQEIAEAVPLRQPEWYSLRHWLGDLAGLSVLDLACGDGMTSRRLKQWGAARVVGVDVSEQMVKLAKEREHAVPLGIEYQVADAAGLGELGQFDRVNASYLLHYAQNREQLLQMVQTAYDNLKPGQLFVASNANPHLPPQPVIDQRKYGPVYRLVEEPLEEGSKLHFTLYLAGKTVEFDIYWISWATYEEAFRTVGFRSWRIEPYRISPELEHEYGEGYWDEYLAAPSMIHFVCQK